MVVGSRTYYVGATLAVALKSGGGKPRPNGINIQS